MGTKLYDSVRIISTRKGAIFFFIIFVLCLYGFSWRRAEIGSKLTLLDSRFYYTPEEAAELFQLLGQQHRHLYAITQITLDVVFPLAYGALLAMAIVRLYSRELGGSLILLPVAAVVADLLENGTAAFLAFTYNGAASPVAWVGSTFTASKWLFFVLFCAVLLVGVLLLRSVLSLVTYAYLLRVPLLTALALVGLCVAAFFTGARSLLANLFDISWPFGIFFLSVLAFLTAWTIMVTWRLVLLYGPERFNTKTYAVQANVKWWHIAIAGGAVALPLVFGAIYWSSRSAVWETIEALAGFLVALILLALASVLKNLLVRPAFSTRPADSAQSISQLTHTSPDMFLPSQNKWIGPLIEKARHQDLTSGQARNITAWFRSFPEELWKGYFSYKDNQVDSILPGHGLAFALLSISLLTYVFVGVYRSLTLSYQPIISFPTLGYVLLLLTLTCWGLSGVTFFLDRFRVPVLVPLVIWLTITSWLPWSDHYYAVKNRTAGSQQGLATATQSSSLADEKPASSDSIIVVAASGGGIQAAAWTARVLTGLVQEFGQNFGKAIRLISSVSGGSVGAMYFLNEYTPAGAPAGADLDRIVDRAEASSLGQIAWGVVYPDFLRLVTSFGFRSDRGRALEEGWLRKDVEWDRRDNILRGLAEWRGDVKAGWRPGSIFNATIADTGERLPLSTIDLPTSEGNQIQNHLFETLNGKDIAVLTAARLSASFPYVSPAARASINNEAAHIVDGGYYDNYGISSLVEWLDFELSKPERQIKKVLVLRIHDSSTGGSCKFASSRGWFYQALAPVATLLNVRSTSQLDHNEIQLKLLIDKWKDAVQIVPAVFEFTGADPPLSWHLNQHEKEQLRRNWQAEINGSKKQKYSDPDRYCSWRDGTESGLDIVRQFLR